MWWKQRTIVIGVVAVGLASAWLSHAVGQPDLQETKPLHPRNALAGCLQVVSHQGEPITAVVYDPQQQSLGVWHIDRTTGALELKSVRRIEWDLQMLHFNGKEPLPEEIRNGLNP